MRLATLIKYRLKIALFAQIARSGKSPNFRPFGGGRPWGRVGWSYTPPRVRVVHSVLCANLLALRFSILMVFLFHFHSQVMSESLSLLRFLSLLWLLIEPPKIPGPGHRQLPPALA